MYIYQYTALTAALAALTAHRHRPHGVFFSVLRADWTQFLACAQVEIYFRATDSPFQLLLSPTGPTLHRRRLLRDPSPVTHGLRKAEPGVQG